MSGTASFSSRLTSHCAVKAYRHQRASCRTPDGRVYPHRWMSARQHGLRVFADSGSVAKKRLRSVNSSDRNLVTDLVEMFDTSGVAFAGRGANAEVLTCQEEAAGLGGIVVPWVATIAMGARIAGCDRGQTALSGPTVDNYSPVGMDNQSNPAYSRRHLVQGGPMPRRKRRRTYPYKSDKAIRQTRTTGCGVVLPGTAVPPLPGPRQQWVSNNCGLYHTPDRLRVGPAPSTRAPTISSRGTNCTKWGLGRDGLRSSARVDSVCSRVRLLHFAWHLHPTTSRRESKSWFLCGRGRGHSERRPGHRRPSADVCVQPARFRQSRNPRAFLNSSYVELSLDDDHAPTDYIWPGRPTWTMTQ